MHRVDHRARGEEQAGLEEGVGQDVEEAGGERADADAQEHVAELADRGVGQHLLDVVLNEGDARREQRRRRADEGHREHDRGAQHEDARHAADQVDASGDHGGGVDQRADRGGARHGVGQPDVQGELRALAGAAQEQRQAHQRGCGDVPGPVQPLEERRQAALDQIRERDLVADRPHLHAGQEVRAPTLDAGPVERADVVEQQRHGHDQAEVADAVGDEGLLAGRGVLLVAEPEADQQVAAQAHALPADEEHRQAVAQDEHQHREDEQVQVGEEAVVALVLLHVLGRVQVDQEADAGDDQAHHAVQGVKGEVDGHGDLAQVVATRDANPLPALPDEANRSFGALGVRRRLRAGQHHERDQAGHERAAYGEERHGGHGLFAQALAEDAVHDGADQRQRQDHDEQRELGRREDLLKPVHRRSFSASGCRRRRC